MFEALRCIMNEVVQVK